MKLVLKESPREWLKFTAVTGLMAAILWSVARMRGWHDFSLALGWAPGAIAVALCLWRPRWFRGYYRAGTTFFHHVGRVMGAVMLTGVFLFVVTPLGWALRLAGKDLLKIRRAGDADSHWEKPGPTGGHEKLF